jgi:hypothetical protein
LPAPYDPGGGVRRDPVDFCTTDSVCRRGSVSQFRGCGDYGFFMGSQCLRQVASVIDLRCAVSLG